jgi:hypothetical protein
MTNKMCSLFLMVGGLLIACVLSYYMNIRFDNKAVIALLNQNFRNMFPRNSVSQSGLNANRSLATARFSIKLK